MALFEIKPVYKEWVRKITPQNIDEYVNKLSNRFNEVINNILRSEVGDEEIDKSVDDLRRRFLYISLAYESMDSIPSIDKKLAKLNKSMNLIDSYEKRNVQVHQKRSMSIIAYISIIVLPLTLITSYFGMNFGSMGAPAKSRGILAFKYGQLFVFVMGLLSIFFAVRLLNKYYKVTY